MRKWRKAAAMCMTAVMMCSMTACGSGNKESADTTAAPAETKAEGSEAAAESSEAGASTWTPGRKCDHDRSLQGRIRYR